MEVNCTDPSPSVRIPWLEYLGFFQARLTFPNKAWTTVKCPTNVGYKGYTWEVLLRGKAQYS